MKKYRPSNGSEGEMFEAQFCDNCLFSKTSLGCPIQTAAMAYDIDDPRYPGVWCVDEEGCPTCTMFAGISDKRIVSVCMMKTEDFQRLVAQADPEECPFLNVEISGSCGVLTFDVVSVEQDRSNGMLSVLIRPDA